MTSYQTGFRKWESDSGMSILSPSSGSDWDLNPPAAITNTRTMLQCNTWEQVQPELALKLKLTVRKGSVNWNDYVAPTCILRKTLRHALNTFSSMAIHCWKSKLLKASARFWLLRTRKKFRTKLQNHYPLIFFQSFTIKDIKPQTNNRNVPTQHSATLLCAFDHCSVICWVLLAQIWPFSNLSQQHPRCRKTSQHSGQKLTTCWTQQCCNMLC